MSFLDLYPEQDARESKFQPNEGTRLPSGFDENFRASWSDGLLFGQSIARANARGAVLDDYLDEIRRKTGRDLTKEDIGASGPETGVTSVFATANDRVAKMKESYPDLDLDPLSDEEIDRRAVAKAQAAHRTYETLQQGEKTFGGSFGSFAGGAASSAADPINILALAVAPETGGASIISAALRWGAVAGVSQAAIEIASGGFKEQAAPGYAESGQAISEIGGAAIGGAVLGGGVKALGNAWTRFKTGAWPTSVRDAGNLLESEANVANTNPLPGVEGEVAHREAVIKTIDDILAGRPVDVSAQITPELQQAAAEAERVKAVSEPPSGMPTQQLELPLQPQRKTVEAYHGSEKEFSSPDTAFGGSRGGVEGEKNVLFFSSTPELAGIYGNNITVKNIDLSNSGTFDVDQLVRDPEFLTDMRAALEGEARRNDYLKERAKTPEGKQAIDDRWSIILDNIQKRENNNFGHVRYDSTITGAIIQRARDEGLDVAIVKNMAEGRGQPHDQYIVLNNKAMLEAKATKQSENIVGPQPQLQTPEDMTKTLTAPDHQDAIRADIDRERAMGDFKVPGVDENGNHVMVGVDAAMEQVDAYKQLAEHIQACANPAQEAAE